jgi:transcriptional regulator with XRE-family HTH domain
VGKSPETASADRPYEDLGNSIREMRKQAKLQSKGLAHQLGISRTHMSRIETGKARPSLNVLKQIAEITYGSIFTLLTQARYLTVNPELVPDHFLPAVQALFDKGNFEICDPGLSEFEEDQN